MLGDIINIEVLKNLDDVNIEINDNIKNIKDFFINNVDTLNKEKTLLEFRRFIEMIMKSNLLVAVTSKTSGKIIAVRDDNLLQLLDNRYYSKIHTVSFLDFFKLETNNYKSLNYNGEPHVKLIINYIISHYNTTFRKFTNRNKEYFYLYQFFYENGEDIKTILDYLNAYHYNLQNINLYNAELSDFRDKIHLLYGNKILKMFDKLKIFSDTDS